MKMKSNRLLLMLCALLIVTCIILLSINRKLDHQLNQERADLLTSVYRLQGESHRWKINNAVLVNTSNHVHFRVESIDYIGEEFFVADNISINIVFRDMQTGKKEKTSIGYQYYSEELKNFQNLRAGATFHREMLEYSNHCIIIEIKYHDNDGSPIFEEIEIAPVWSFEG